MPSLLNGLSSLGSGVANYAGTIGAEAQKNDAAMALQQSGGVIQGGLMAQRGALDAELARQADAMATTRESSGRIQAGQIAATAATQAQGSAMALEAYRASHTPELELLRALGALPAASAPAPLSPASAATTSPVPSSSGQSASTNPTPSSDAAAASSPSTGTSPSAAPSSTPMAEDLIRKTLALPALGSEAANRAAIARGVATAPESKYLPADQQAALVENKYQIATNKIADPATRDAIATAIANYQLSPLDERARQMAGGPETMKKVLDFNPDYQEGRYPEINKALVAFGPGKEGQQTRFLNVGVQHLDVFDQAAQALKNGDVKALNSLGNYFQDQFGVAPPNTFEGLKQIVGTEIEKAIAGGIGASSDRDRLMASLNRANSPEALQAMTNGFRALMGGQLKGLQRQYEDATPNTPSFRGSGQFAFSNKLDPDTVKALSGSSVRPMAPMPQPQESAGVGAEGLPSTPATPTAPTILRYDSSGNRIGAP